MRKPDNDAGLATEIEALRAHSDALIAHSHTLRAEAEARRKRKAEQAGADADPPQEPLDPADKGSPRRPEPGQRRKEAVAARAIAP
jgi:hypothetical protein